MAQKGLMRILSRKDGKGTVTNLKENEKVKLTKVLEFVPARKPEQAKITHLSIRKYVAAMTLSSCLK